VALGRAGLLVCWAGLAVVGREGKLGRPERAVGLQAVGKLFLFFFIFPSFLYLSIFQNLFK
jgi:hypothetical protein